MISGDFGWAVLCQQGKFASLMIYGEDGGKPGVFGTHGAGLVDDPEAARNIRIVQWDYVARHNPGLRSAPGDCIEDGAGMGSTLYCYLDGRWTALAGAD